LRNNGDGTLAPPVFIDTGFFTFSMAVGDVDGNGSLDVALGNFGDVRRVDVLRNRGDGTFLPPEPYFDEGANSLAIADLDRDGRADLVVASGPGFGVHLLWNEGGGTFAQPPLVPAPIAPNDLALADVDGDGRQDVVAVDAQAGKLAVFLGRGAGAFGPPQLTDLAGGIAVQATDLDGDGRPDLVVGSATLGIEVLRNVGSGTFTSIQTILGVGSAFALGDLDGDGRLDLVVLGTAPKSIAFRPGLADGTFGAEVVIGQDFAGSFAVADLDGDGKMDVVYSASIEVRTLRNLGGGLFGPPVTLATGLASAGSIAVGDLDGDGRPDLAVSDLSNEFIGVVLNNRDGTFGRMQTVPLFQPQSLKIAAIPGRTRGVVVARDSPSETVTIVEVASGGTVQPARRWATRGGGSAFAVGDVDGDLRPDVVAGAVGGFAVLRATCLP
jgi:hypothetical protein